MRESDKQSKIALKTKLSEAQNHRCCYCGIHMDLEANHHNSVVVEKIVATDNPNDWYNLVASCYSCNNRRNGRDALEYFETIKKMGRQRAIPTEKDVDAELQERIKSMVKDKLSMSGIPFVLTGIIRGAEHAANSEENLEKLVENLVDLNTKKYQNTNGRIVLHKRRWRSNTKMRKRLSSEQNHRCCYCGIDLQCEHPEQHDYATIEHVIERAQGGSDRWDNFAVCCHVCNSHRGELGLSATDYYEHVRLHGRHVRKKKPETVKAKKKKHLQDLYAAVG